MERSETEHLKRREAELQAKLFAAEQRRAAFLALTTRMRLLDSPEIIMQAAAETVGRHLAAHRVGFFDIAPDDLIRFTVGWSDPARLPLLTGTWPQENIGPAYLTEVRKGKVFGITDTRINRLTSESRFDSIGARAVIGVPMIRNGNWTSGLYVHYAEPRQWSDDDIAFADEIGQLTWDIVERARAEEKRRAKAETLRAAIDESETGTWDYNIKSGVLYCSDQTKAAFGISPDMDCSIEDFYAVLHPDDRGRVMALIDSIIKGKAGILYAAEYRTIGREDGVLRSIAAKGVGVFDRAGKCIRAVGTVIDMTAAQPVNDGAISEMPYSMQERGE